MKESNQWAPTSSFYLLERSFFQVYNQTINVSSRIFAETGNGAVESLILVNASFKAISKFSALMKGREGKSSHIYLLPIKLGIWRGSRKNPIKGTDKYFTYFRRRTVGTVGALPGENLMGLELYPTWTQHSLKVFPDFVHMNIRSQL